ncbi:transposase [Candidatus Poribacteria bacterium]|nr:transposase [Candidatus Poribacteria bacterium]
MVKRRKLTPKFKAAVVLEALRGESSQAELCRHHNLSETQVSTWKRQLLENAETFFESEDRFPSRESAERIAQLEQLVGRLTLVLEIQKKSTDFLGLTPSQQPCLIERTHSQPPTTYP